MKLCTLLGAFLALFTSISIGQILNIVAHQDDDLLFLSPDLIHYIQSGHEVRTVFITAGDSGREASYWQAREEGARTAYAVMSGSPNTWAETDAGIPEHRVPLFKLEGTGISLIFLRLPDGNLQGQGFEVTGSSSLQKLWEGSIPSIQTVTGAGSYTKGELINTLVHLFDDFRPERVNTLDYHHPYGDGDHSDHHSVGYFVNEALKLYGGNPVLAGYIGYPVVDKKANVFGDDLVAKQLAFYAYGRNDPIVCNSHLACANDAHYPRWNERQHTVDERPVANAGSAQVAALNVVVTLDGSRSSGPRGEALWYEWTQVRGSPIDLVNADTSSPSFSTPSDPDTLVFELVVGSQQSSSPAEVTVTTLQYPENIALKARVTASSSNIGANQTPDKAIDQNIGGFPVDHSHEWVTDGGKAGSWLNLTWDHPQTASRIVLYDRPNLDDLVLGATIAFDDGESIQLDRLSNYGTAKVVEAGDKVIHSLEIRITAVSPSTMNVGLSEVQVFGASV
ncbi:putative deacetylase LmbE-like domain-containing protein [Aspergillus karnatakaensis]|uniref:putative deacetylase LmbE-like domain-containing protein n=1 Tax=Aspergillus karnatakaensis TaxID=1810916 RepID=UPI003CCE0387